MSSVAAESKQEMVEKNGDTLAGLPFEVKQGFGDKYLEYNYDGRPLVIYGYLPWFTPIVKLMEQYRDLERQTLLLIRQRDEALAKCERLDMEVNPKRKKGSNHE